LQGTWVCVAAGREKQLGRKELGALDLQLTISGDEVTISYNDNELHRHQAVGKLVVDTSKGSPRFQIDFHLSGINASGRLTYRPLTGRGVLHMNPAGGTFLVHRTFESEPSVFEFKRLKSVSAEGEGSQSLNRNKSLSIDRRQ
jgi:hypothetical protein